MGEEETGVGAGTPGQPEPTTPSGEAPGVGEGVPPVPPTTEFDFSSIPEEAWKSDRWYEHVPPDAVNLDKFPQFGDWKRVRDQAGAQQQRELEDAHRRVSEYEQIIEYQELEGLTQEERTQYELEKLRGERVRTTEMQQFEAVWDAEWERVLDAQERLMRVAGVKDPRALEVNADLFYQDPSAAIADLEKQAMAAREKMVAAGTPPPIVESHAGGATGGGLIEEVGAKPFKEQQRIYLSEKEFKKLLLEAASKS